MIIGRGGASITGVRRFVEYVVADWAAGGYSRGRQLGWLRAGVAMATIRAMVLRAAGTNCDLEALHAWELAGARPERVHVRRVIEHPPLLDEFQILTIPGGFSYGDDIAAGRIFAAQIQRNLLGALRGFIDRGGLVIGICNGFQILVKAGLLPDPHAGVQEYCTVTFNEPAGFQDRWVGLEAGATPCVFLEPGRTYELPIAHGEGRVAFDSDERMTLIEKSGLAALRYVTPGGNGETPLFAGNPNGSMGNIAGLCDASGRVFGLMPHPDRFVTWTQHPCWSSLPKREEADGLAMFRRAVATLRAS